MAQLMPLPLTVSCYVVVVVFYEAIFQLNLGWSVAPRFVSIPFSVRPVGRAHADEQLRNIMLLVVHWMGGRLAVAEKLTHELTVFLCRSPQMWGY